LTAAGYWLMTERLALRRFRPDDLDRLAALHTDADVTRYLGGLRDRAGAEQLLNVRILQYYDQHPGSASGRRSSERRARASAITC